MEQGASNHGRVRVLLDGSIGVTLAGCEHGFTLAEALGLANAIIFTCVDSETRNMRDSTPDHPAHPLTCEAAG